MFDVSEDASDRLSRFRVLPVQQDNFLGVFRFTDFLGNPCRTFITGQNMRCIISFRHNTDLTVTQLKVKMLGILCYRFSKKNHSNQPDPQVFYAKTLFSFGREDDLPQGLDALSYTIPIDINIPNNLPSSFNEDNSKEIVYCMLVEASRPRLPKATTFDCFDIENTSILYLNERIPLEISKFKTFMWIPVARMSISLPKQAFLRGEDFEVDLDLTVIRCGETRLDTIEFNLICSKEYRLKYDTMFLDDDTIDNEYVYRYTLPPQYVSEGETKRFKGLIKVPKDSLPSFDGIADDIYAVSYHVYVKARLCYFIFKKNIEETLAVKVCTTEESETDSLPSSEYPFKYLNLNPPPPEPPVVIQIDPAEESDQDSEPESPEPVQSIRVPVEIHQEQREQHKINPIQEIEEDEAEDEV